MSILRYIVAIHRFPAPNGTSVSNQMDCPLVMLQYGCGHDTIQHRHKIIRHKHRRAFVRNIRQYIFGPQEATGNNFDEMKGTDLLDLRPILRRLVRHFVLCSAVFVLSLRICNLRPPSHSHLIKTASVLDGDVQLSTDDSCRHASLPASARASLLS